MRTRLERHTRIPKSATPSQHRFSDAVRPWFRGLTVVAAVLIATTACGETTSTDPAEEVSAAVEVPDQCPDGLRVIEDPEATKDLRCADLTDAKLTGARLTDADLTGTIWADTTCPDGSDSDTDGRDSCS